MKKHLEHKGYIGSAKFSTEDNCFFGKITNINDLVSYEGTSFDELNHVFKEALEDYLIDVKEKTIR